MYRDMQGFTKCKHMLRKRVPKTDLFHLIELKPPDSENDMDMVLWQEDSRSSEGYQCQVQNYSYFVAHGCENILTDLLILSRRM